MTAPMMTLLMAEDVQELLGEEFEGSEPAQVNALIRYASALIRTKVSALDARIVSGSLSLDLVSGAMVVAVARALEALRAGLRVQSQQYPEVTTTYQKSGITGLVYFTVGELAPLVESGTRTGKAYTVTPVGSLSEYDDVAVPWYGAP